MLRPPAVKKGARIIVISPASSAKPERITAGIEALRALGYDAVAAEHAYGKSPQYFGGTVGQRLGDLHAAFADENAAAIICSRGGYGSNYLLEGLDRELIRRHAKPLLAYSDMTAIQTWLLDEVGLVGFHGPMAAADFYLPDGVHQPSLDAAWSGGMAMLGGEEGLRVLRRGRAKGVMYGGCLTLLTASLGTRFAVKTKGKLLFLEDVSTKPYQIDRMLRQMMMAGKLDGVKGIIFGEMLDCVSAGMDASMLDEAILRVLDEFNGPIAIGLRSGHVSRANVTLPMGIEAELILESEPVLRYLQPAVQV
jgi:muramoyltetrapeptide carboxypeptidase